MFKRDEKTVKDMQPMVDTPAFLTIDCIKTKTRKNADRIMHIFADMARERGIEVSSTMNYTVVLEGEAKYLFVSQNVIDRLRGIGYFTDIVEDNEMFAHLQREPSGIVWEKINEQHELQ
jgi:glutaminase